MARLFVVSSLSVALLASGCDSMSGEDSGGVKLLPKAPVEATNFSPYRPASPFTSLVPGLSARRVFEGSSGNGYKVEVWDLLVGPNKISERANLGGAAVFEVRSGSATITVGKERQEVKSGSTLSLPDGAEFTIDNRSNDPITIQAYVFKAE